jgi:hypothetical protein
MALSLKSWVKVNGQWQESNILVKNNNTWKESCPAIKQDNDWIKKIECSQVINPTFSYGSYTERYLQVIDTRLFQVFEGSPEFEVYGGTPGITEGTRVDVQFSGPIFGFVNPDPPLSNRPYASPRFMNALHLGVIPKGPHRGKLIAMNADVIIASGSPYLNNQQYSFQTAAIVDFDKTAGTPQKPRFLNFQIPTEKPYVYTEGAFTFSSYPNLFCCGHAWSPSGDFVMAGGSTWTWKSTGGAVQGVGQLGAWDATYVWNPALPGSWTSSTYAGATRTDIQVAFTSGHYVSAGAWVRGPDMDSPRWYPTVLPYPRVSRTSNRHHCLLFGGDPLVRDQALTGSFAVIPSEFNSYESLVISSMATSSNPGVYKDSYNGSTTFGGPSERNFNEVYSALNVTANDPNSPCPLPNLPIPGDVDYVLSIFNDSLYYYPRCFTTSSGGVSFAGFTHRSSLLYNHDTGPGIWDTTVGNNPRTFDAHDFYRWYGSAFRIPNNLNKNKIDDIVRCGGANTFTPIISDQDTWTTDILKLSDIQGLVGTNNGISWSGWLPMAEERSTFNTVILPNASVFAVGGLKNNEAAELCSTAQLRQFLENGGKLNTFDVSPLLIGDHHRTGMGPPTPVPIVINNKFQPDDNHLEHIIEMVNEVYDTQILESNSLGNTAGQYHFLVSPEILNPERTLWTLVNEDVAKTLSWRDYHSASILLPDGRIVVAGGEFRHSALNPKISFDGGDLFNIENVAPMVRPFYGIPGIRELVNGTGWDYEIFTPGYLQEGLMPDGVGISGATYNSHPQIDCYELNYNGQYIVSSNALYNNGSISKVVFMPPGCVTHHADITQRYYECNLQTISQTQVRITMPNSEGILPRGFYMMFVVSNIAVPSKATWVWLN